MLSLVRSAIAETYVNGREGLEHGFRVEKRHNGSSGRFWLQLAITGKVQLSARTDTDVEVRTEHGVLTYGGLRAWDSRGLDLPATVSVTGNSIYLHVEDREATYPVTIDPLWTVRQRLVANDPLNGELMGEAIATSGDHALFSSWYRDDRRGAAVAFDRTDGKWSQTQFLTASDAAPKDFFSYSMDMDGDTAVIGAFQKDGLRGAAYIFVHDGTSWVEQQKLVAVDPRPGACFGTSVRVLGDTVLVGAPFPNKERNAPAPAEAVYVFRRVADSWTQVQKITTPNSTKEQYFGLRLDMSPSAVAISALGRTGNPDRVYAFNLQGGLWNLRQSLSPTDWEPTDSFGLAVRLSGGHLLVGAPDKNAGQGVVYSFENTEAGWVPSQILPGPSSSADSSFGRFMDTDGSSLAVGNPSGSTQESVFIYDWLPRGGWKQRSRIPSSSPGLATRFGADVAFSDAETLLVGAYGDSLHSGAVFACGLQTDLALTFAFRGTVGGSVGLGTARIFRTAPPGGVTIKLTPDTPNLEIPPSVLIPEGQSTTQFPVTTHDVATATSVTVTAESAGPRPGYGVILIDPLPLLASINLGTAVLIENHSILCTLTTKTPAPPGGASIPISVDRAEAATVKTTVRIDAGQTVGRFRLVAKSVTSDTVVTVSAQTARSQVSAKITVQNR